MKIMKKIKEIEVENVKGIESRVFDVEVFPNKPTIFVAPNGNGKSSLAAAFASLKTTKIELKKEHFHKNDESLSPKLSITFEDLDGSETVVSADAGKNEIAQNFDIKVINSQLIPKARRMSFGGSSKATSTIEVSPAILVNSIPEKVDLDYQISDAKVDFGKNGKVLPNISSHLKNDVLMSLVGEGVDFSKQSQVGHSKKLSDFISDINLMNGSSDSIKASIPDHSKTSILSVPHIKGVVELIERHTSLAGVDAILSAIQICELRKRDPTKFKSFVKRSSYSVQKTEFTEIFRSLGTTWKDISPREVRGTLVVEFPKAHEISNGERDVISFVAQLVKIQVSFTKPHGILIVDEIFDYLDDANLIACQFYLSRLISEMKSDGKKLCPIILTHLDPWVFKNFAFSNLKVCHLSKAVVTDRSVESIILKRDEQGVQAPLSSHFLHHHSEDKDLSVVFARLGLDAAKNTAKKFRAHCQVHLQKYIDGNSYDPLSVCCGVRLLVEQKAFGLLDTEFQRDEFLETHKTTKKLEYVLDQGFDVPEINFLLGIIYNDSLHLRAHQDNFSRIVSKLENNTIKNMIKNI
jgi:hypothetical protein